MNYHLIQLGCQMNHADGQRIAAVLDRMGFRACDKEEDAQLLGIVACSVRQKAIDKVYSMIQKWNTWKHEKNLLTFVSGCILPEDREKFLDRFDLLFSINELPQLPSMISQYGVASPYSARHAFSADEQTGGGPDAVDLRALTASLEQTADEAASGVAETAAPSLRPVGPIWLKDRSRGPLDTAALKQGGVEYRADHSPRKEKELEERRRSTLRSIRLMQDQLKSEGGAESIGQSLVKKDGAADPMGGFWHIRPHYSSDFEAFVPIQNGCDKFCTFCAVPYTRGREISRPSADILEEVEGLIARGYRSITLLGQNVNSYGKDKAGEELSFARLLEEIALRGEARGKHFWVYFTSPHPRDMTVDVLETIAAHECLAKNIHLPLQSGDDKVLMKMNRKHSMARYREVAESVRRILPGATLFTDIIVGFTGETREQFESTKKAMEEFRYQMAFVAMYSPRPGAASSRWDDDVPLEEKKRRLQELSDLLHRNSLAFNQSLLGSTMRILVEGEDRKSGFLSGRNEGRIQVRFALPEGGTAGDFVGEFVELTVTSVKALSMEGEFLRFSFPDERRSEALKTEAEAGLSR